VVVPAPSFSGYVLVGELMGARVIPVPLAGEGMDLPAMACATAEYHARLLFICRPNNPTGTVFTEGELRSALDQIPDDTLVVLDEAYAEFDTTGFDSHAFLLEWPNVIVTRTFSKLHGLAGLRLGYGIMRPEIMAPLLRARDPFSVNSVAAAAGVAALDDTDHRVRTEALVACGKLFLYNLFERLGLRYVSTEANFVLVHLPCSAVDAYEALLRHGVLVRPCASFGLPESIRITIGTQAQNETFATALEAVLRTLSPT
jgi:histidinol-phosphate aminotransferase